VKTFAPAVDPEGGLRAELIETTSSSAYEYTGNYVLVLAGSCDIDGTTYGKDVIVVGKTVTPEPYSVAGSGDGACLAMGISF
jgi:hypothetical protein